MNDVDALNFFRDDGLVADPYPYFDALRGQCPVRREPYHDVMMVTGYDEAVQVFHDAGTFSSCISVTGPFPGFPVPLEGDDITALIEAHRGQLPMSDQLPTLDPPAHTAHRALLMRLITPKRLKENEASMWTLADRLLEEYLAPGEGEFISGFAGPFTLLVIADLLGVPEEDLEEFTQALQNRPRSDNLGSTGEDTLTHSPLEFLYGKFAAYVEDRRREPRGDVLTGLATATFPDGSVPEVADVARANARHHLAFGRGIHTCPGAPLARAEARVAIERILDRTAGITISERGHGPAEARRYRYIPTFILRGLAKLNLEFMLAGEQAR